MPLFDALEPVFGPDPGLLRLKVAVRAVCAAAIALTLLQLTIGGASRGAITAIALAFMTANLSNVAVRDKQPGQQALTLALMALPALGATVLSAWLSNWKWLGELGFVLVVAAASLARLAGQRGFAFGIVAFICYLVGEILHPPLDATWLLVAGVAAGLGAAALMRFVILPDNPRATIRHLARHLNRRVARVLAVGGRALAQSDSDDKLPRRMHRELVRLNDTFQAASEQLGEMEEAKEADDLRHRLLAVEFAAERLLRAAARQSPQRRDGDAERLTMLARDLRKGRLPSSQPVLPSAKIARLRRDAPVQAALDALERALAELEPALS